MLQFLYDLGLFLAKAAIFGFAFIMILGAIVRIIRGSNRGSLAEENEPELVLENYTEKLKDEQVSLTKLLLSEEETKLLARKEKARAKKEAKLIKAQLKKSLSDKKKAQAELEKKVASTTKPEEKLENNESEKDLALAQLQNQENDAGSDESKLAEQNKHQEENLNVSKKILFIADFDGSVDAKEVSELRRTITLITSMADEGDELLLRLTSPGGTVNGYGLCAAELERIKKKKIKLTIAVDEVAASGGYMMACVADHLMAAPFAYIGSIGVVAEFPNFNRLLKKYDVDYEQVTAGDFKRTLTQFGENTPEAREKFKDELKRVHIQFKNHVSAHRPKLDIEKIANGEHWLANDALELGLIDEIKTSDEYIMDRIEDVDVAVKISYVLKKKKGLLALLHDKSALADFCVLLLRKLNLNRSKI